MNVEKLPPVNTPCLCNALRRAARTVSRLYDEELRTVGLRTTQYSLLSLLGRVGEVRQRELSGLTLLDETTLTRALRPLVESGWVAVRAGEDRREKLVMITEAKLHIASQRIGEMNVMMGVIDAVHQRDIRLSGQHDGQRQAQNGYRASQRDKALTAQLRLAFGGPSRRKR